MTRRCNTATLIVLVAVITVCSGFQAIVPSAVRPTPAVASLRPLFAEVDSDTDNKSTTDDSTTTTTDIDVPKFDAKDFDEDSGPSFDWFSFVLIGYIVFAIADTAFHITPQTPYVQMVIEALTGQGGETSS